VVERFLVKWKGLSHLHVSWETSADLGEIIGQHAKSAIRRHREALPQLLEDDRGDGEYFDPLCTQIERVIDTDAVDGEPTRYLIKWAGCPYSESTYESESDLQQCSVDYAA
ncbi:hypothetical protein JKP88DRAFT_191699, partial [Tribonema minus]